MRLRTLAIAFGVFVASLFTVPIVAPAQNTASQNTASQNTDAPTPDDLSWPRVIEGDNGATFSIFQPQIDKFDAETFEARAAVQVEIPVGERTQTSFGVVWIQAHPFIDK